MRADAFGQLHERHRLAWNRLWERFEITITGSERTQLLLRLHVFHLLQTLSAHTIDLDVGVPARGLHGEAYQGTCSGMSCSSSRCSTTACRSSPARSWSTGTVDCARRGGRREQGYEGALFPWQSGSDGRERGST